MHAPSDSQSARSKRSNLPPATYSASDTFGLIGCSYSTGMELLKAGNLPLEPIRIGRVFRFRKSEVHTYLGIEDNAERGVA
jgi:excisionase family DNA binding protein